MTLAKLELVRIKDLDDIEEIPRDLREMYKKELLEWTDDPNYQVYVVVDEVEKSVSHIARVNGAMQPVTLLEKFFGKKPPSQTVEVPRED